MHLKKKKIDWEHFKICNLSQITSQRLLFFDHLSLKSLSIWLRMTAVDPSYPNLFSTGVMSSIGQFLTAIASSAYVERFISKFGNVHADERNRLHMEKAASLGVYLLKN